MPGGRDGRPLRLPPRPAARRQGLVQPVDARQRQGLRRPVARHDRCRPRDRRPRRGSGPHPVLPARAPAACCAPASATSASSRSARRTISPSRNDSPPCSSKACPKLGTDQRNEARRFVTLIDALYEAQTKLVVLADGEPEELYPAGDGLLRVRTHRVAAAGDARAGLCGAGEESMIRAWVAVFCLALSALAEPDEPSPSFPPRPSTRTRENSDLRPPWWRRSRVRWARMM